MVSVVLVDFQVLVAVEGSLLIILAAACSALLRPVMTGDCHWFRHFHQLRFPGWTCCNNRRRMH